MMGKQASATVYFLILSIIFNRLTVTEAKKGRRKRTHRAKQGRGKKWQSKQKSGKKNKSGSSKAQTFPQNPVFVTFPPPSKGNKNGSPTIPGGGGFNKGYFGDHWSTVGKFKQPKQNPGPDGNILNSKQGVVSLTDDIELTITSCSYDSVYVKGSLTDSLGPGTFLVRTGDGNLCTNCGPLFRKIITSTRDVAGGSTSFVLTTEFATFQDIYDNSLFDPLLASLQIEPIFKCAHSSSRRALIARRDYNDGRHRNLQVPACDSWRAKNQDGRCTYTDCFVGKAGNPDECFACGTTCGDGCGAEGGIAVDGDFTEYNFAEACCIHDYCYGSSYSQDDCDVNFLGNMRSKCPLENFVSSSFSFPVPVLGSTPDLNQALCHLNALLFYAVVAGLGDAAYATAQATQKAYELTPPCIVKCPTLKTSGGQGGTHLTVNVKATSGTLPVKYEMYSFEDELTIKHEGVTIFSTGGPVSGSKKVDVPFSGSTSIMEVIVHAPDAETKWWVEIDCAEQ